MQGAILHFFSLISVQGQCNFDKTQNLLTWVQFHENWRQFQTGHNIVHVQDDDIKQKVNNITPL